MQAEWFRVKFLDPKPLISSVIPNNPWMRWKRCSQDALRRRRNQPTCHACLRDFESSCAVRSMDVKSFVEDFCALLVFVVQVDAPGRSDRSP
jgi:hypothetical protein